MVTTSNNTRRVYYFLTHVILPVASVKMSMNIAYKNRCGNFYIFHITGTTTCVSDVCMCVYVCMYVSVYVCIICVQLFVVVMDTYCENLA